MWKMQEFGIQIEWTITATRTPLATRSTRSTRSTTRNPTMCAATWNTWWTWRSLSRWTRSRKKFSLIIWRKENSFDTERIGGSLSILKNRTEESSFWLQRSVVHIEPFTPRIWRTTTRASAILEISKMAPIIEFFLQLVAMEWVMVELMTIQMKVRIWTYVQNDTQDRWDPLFAVFGQNLRRATFKIFYFAAVSFVTRQLTTHRARALLPYLQHCLPRLPYIHCSASVNPAQIHDVTSGALWLSPHPSHSLPVPAGPWRWMLPAAIASGYSCTSSWTRSRRQWRQPLNTWNMYDRLVYDSMGEQYFVERQSRRVVNCQGVRLLRFGTLSQWQNCWVPRSVA